MTNNEIKLINMIRENDNSEQAVLIAIDTILSFLEQHESYQVPSVVCLPGQA